MKYIAVSIIIPIYNMEQYLEECLLSVQKQSLKEIEIICIDDGSTDSTPQILQRLSVKYNNIKIYNQNHQGAGKARNFGMQQSNGKYIAFLDADDFYYDEHALRKIIEYCDKKQLNICGSYRMSLTDGVCNDTDLLKDFNIERETILKYEDFQYDFDYQSFVFRREFLNIHHLQFPDYRRYQDPPFFVEAMILAKSFGVVPTRLYCYRYGHQDANVIINGVTDILQGITDVLNISIRCNFKKLYEITIYRLNVTFYHTITKSMSDEVLKRLIQISEITQKSVYDTEIVILEQIRALARLERERVFLQRLVDIQNNQVFLESYFYNKKISEVVIRGMGVYGHHLLRVLLLAKVKVVAIVDQKFVASSECKVLLPDEEIPKCDAIIISLLEPEDILNEYKKDGVNNVLTFWDIMEEIAKMMQERNNE